MNSKKHLSIFKYIKDSWMHYYLLLREKNVVMNGTLLAKRL